LLETKNIFPLLNNLKSYNRGTFRADLIAGLTVGIILVPQGMAYAMLAGVDPIYGLYAGLIPLLVYAFLGSSTRLSIGPVAVSALLVLSGVSQLAEPFTIEYLNLVILAGLLIGCFQLILSLFRLGFLANFISHPVIAGFTSAAAIIISISQLDDMLGIKSPFIKSVPAALSYLQSHLNEAHVLSIVLCLGAIFFMWVSKKISKKIPAALLVVAIGTLLSWYFQLESKGIEIIKDVPGGLPQLQLPVFSSEIVKSLIPTVLSVTVIGIVESIGIAKALESKHNDHTVKPNQELFALGSSKLLGSFFQAIPTSGSFSRSAINSNSGGKTGVASIVTFCFVILTLLFFTPLFYYLPKTILAAIILSSVLGLFDYKEAIHLWKTHRQDFLMMLITFIVTLAIGIEEGVLAGVLLSIVMVLYRSSKPHLAILGQIDGTEEFRNVDRYKDLGEHKEMTIVRFDDQLYFGNASYFKDEIKTICEERPDTKHLILDGSNMHHIDSSGCHALYDTDQFLKQQGVHLYMAGAIGPVRDMLFKSGLMKEPEKHFLNVYDAVQTIKDNNINMWNARAVQRS